MKIIQLKAEVKLLVCGAEHVAESPLRIHKSYGTGVKLPRYPFYFCPRLPNLEAQILRCHCTASSNN